MKREDMKPEWAAETSTIPDEQTHSEDGVDLTIIRWMLSLSPAERLRVLQNNLRSILRLRGDQRNT